MWRNDMKCKYVFNVPSQNFILASKGINMIESKMIEIVGRWRVATVRWLWAAISAAGKPN